MNIIVLPTPFNHEQTAKRVTALLAARHHPKPEVRTTVRHHLRQSIHNLRILNHHYGQTQNPPPLAQTQ
jgi:hypothetical protein